MQTERGRVFEQNEPALDKDEAMAAFAAGGAALSLRGLPCIGVMGAIEYLAVKFALAGGGFATVLLDRMAAAALKTLIDRTDSINWDGNALRPGPAVH
jgi:hypothetical protein